jgi:hypothetical protein
LERAHGRSEVKMRVKGNVSSQLSSSSAFFELN